MDVREKMYELFDELGMERNQGEVDIKQYITDSIQFINFIVKLEEKFDIEIPEDYLIIDKFNDVDNMIEVCEKCIVEKNAIT